MRKSSKKTDSKNSPVMSLGYVIMAVALLGVLVYITYSLTSQVYKQNQINKEISALESKISDLNQENQDLNELIGYLQTDEFKEREAKDKLNLIKEGEQLVLIKEKEAQIETNSEEIEKKQAEVVVRRENYYWWWHYFFSLK